MYVCMYVCMCVYIYIYIYIYTCSGPVSCVRAGLPRTQPGQPTKLARPAGCLAWPERERANREEREICRYVYIGIYIYIY